MEAFNHSTTQDCPSGQVMWWFVFILTSTEPGITWEEGLRLLSRWGWVLGIPSGRFYCVCVCMCMCTWVHIPCVVRVQLVGVSSCICSCGPRGWDTDHQTCQQGPWASEPYCSLPPLKQNNNNNNNLSKVILHTSIEMGRSAHCEWHHSISTETCKWREGAEGMQVLTTSYSYL